MRTIYTDEVEVTHHIGEKWDVQILKGKPEARVVGRRGKTWENPIQCHVTKQDGSIIMIGDYIPQHVVNKVKTFLRGR